MMGLPYNLLSHEYKAEDVRRGRLSDSPVDFFRKVAQGLESDPEQVVQKMYDREAKMNFVRAMNDAGHTHFDAVRTAIVYSGDRGHKVYTPQEQWAMLSKREQQIATEPSKERLHGEITRELVHGNASARLEISLWTEGRVWYDPAVHQMKGVVTGSEYDAVYANLRPLVNPNASHDEYLMTRRQAQELVKKVGFPERSRILW